MNTGLTTWFRRQSVMALPGALAALALTLPVWRYRVLWHLNVEAIFFELHDVILYLSDLLALLAIAAMVADALSPADRQAASLAGWRTGRVGALRDRLGVVGATGLAGALPGRPALAAVWVCSWSWRPRQRRGLPWRGGC